MGIDIVPGPPPGARRDGHLRRRGRAGHIGARRGAAGGGERPADRAAATSSPVTASCSTSSSSTGRTCAPRRGSATPSSRGSSRRTTTRTTSYRWSPADGSKASSSTYQLAWGAAAQEFSGSSLRAIAERNPCSVPSSQCSHDSQVGSRLVGRAPMARLEIHVGVRRSHGPRDPPVWRPPEPAGRDSPSCGCSSG